jgi:hypothetical protein
MEEGGTSGKKIVACTGRTCYSPLMKVRLLVCIALFLAHMAPACIQVTGTKYNAMPGTWSGISSAARFRHYMTMPMHPDGVQMEAELRNEPGLSNRSDYSVALMYLGRYNQAVALLQQLEKKEPGHYFIAANLGTAYELSGDNTNALRWIREGIRRNPDSHEGTEWLHARILEAKIAQQKDADYFKKHSVLDLHPGDIDTEEGAQIDGKHFSPGDIAHAIDYQLRERMQFVKPPDQAVAALLFDYAAIDARIRSLESATKVVQLAVEYGYPPDQAQPLVRSFSRKIFLRKVIQYGLIPGAAIGLLVFLRRRGHFVLSG